MDEQDVLDAPTKIMLFTWLHNLFQNGNAEYNEENSNIIDLDSYASSVFSIGRTNDDLVGFLGIPRNFIPWFINIKFKRAVISTKRKRLYLSCGDEETEGFTLSFKIREKRMLLLWNKENKDTDVKKLDMRMFGIKADNTIILNENILSTIPLIKSDDLDKVVFEDRIVPISREDMFADEIRAKFEKEYYKKYIELDNGEKSDEY